MGRTVIPIVPVPRRPPDRESFHLGVAREAYARGDLDLDELEGSVEHVLRGGHLSASGRVPRPGDLPSLPDPSLVRRETRV